MLLNVHNILPRRLLLLNGIELRLEVDLAERDDL